MSTGHGLHALVADRAVVGDVAELVEVAEADAAARLLLVQERLDQQRRREDLVARAVEQVRARHVRRAHRLALAAAQAVLDRVGDAADVARLEDQALVADQREARRVRAGQVRGPRRIAQQLAAVEAALGIDRSLVRGERRDLVVGQVLELGDADAVLAGDHAAQAPRERHDARDRRVGVLQHRVVVGVDGQVRVHVAVARVHVQRDEHAAAQHPRVDVRAGASSPARTRVPRRSPRAAPSVRASTTRGPSDPAARRTSRRCASSRSCQRARVAATSSRASSTFASTISCGGRVSLSGGHACASSGLARNAASSSRERAACCGSTARC